ncbi:3-hydroxyacyl-CoA dehydrogenase family protein [Virgibacillus byunsanensis]|uniref:L-gulonate 3-dehydrogenase n=1 Tax=Virgibacillus byunsanensis TaxID=570945 RepID=A0ABW3LMK2_9BACI
MIQNITVLGSGVMGHGIAQNYAFAGYMVHMYDLKEAYLTKALTLIDANLSLLIRENIITQEEKDSTLERITVTTDLVTATKNADFITEAVPEVLDIKHTLFKKLEEVTGKDTIIASNTSTFSVAQLAEKMENPNRLIITHFFNPAQIVPLVEIVKHDKTSDSVVDTAMNLMKAIGKSPVVLNKDVPGFIANRLQAALVREAFYLLDEGVADAESIDLALTDGPGFRWAFSGPFKTADYGGHDIWKSVVENLAPELSKAEIVPKFIKEKVENGKLGTKSGEGIYTYSNSVVEEKVTQRDENLIRLKQIKSRK